MLLVLGEAHLRRILTKYAAYYNELRTHRSLNKDAPIHRTSSTWAASYLCPSSAAFITTIAESSFQYTQPAPTDLSIPGARSVHLAGITTMKQQQGGVGRTCPKCPRRQRSILGESVYPN